MVNIENWMLAMVRESEIAKNNRLLRFARNDVTRLVIPSQL